MFSLSRILLRYCQSAIVALALCLVPGAEAGFAQAVRNIASEFASEFDTWVAQELILPGDTTELDLIEALPSPESTHSAEFSELTNFSVPEAEESEIHASPRVSPDDFLNQPTISSQLLLPPGEEAVQLLLAPAPQTSQLFLPAATETQLLLPAAQDTEQTERSAPVTTQRFLPAATMPVGLLSPAQGLSSANPLAIAIEEETDRQRSVESPTRQTSVQEQVGRSLANTTIDQPPSKLSSREYRDNHDVPDAVTPRSSPALLPASSIPRTPLPRSPQAVVFMPKQTSSVASLAMARETISDDRAAKPSPEKIVSNSGETSSSLRSSKSSNPDLQIDSTRNNEEETPSSVASREIGVAVAPEVTASPWLSLQNQVLAALGVLILFLFGLIRWFISRGQASIVEEIDWDSLPRSKSREKNILPPVSPRRKRDLSQALESLQTSPPVMSPFSVASSVVLSASSDASVAESLSTAHPVPTVTDLQPRRSRPVFLSEDEDQLPLSGQELQKQRFGIAHHSDFGVWITIVLIGCIALGAWFIQFYGVI